MLTLPDGGIVYNKNGLNPLYQPYMKQNKPWINTHLNHQEPYGKNSILHQDLLKVEEKKIKEITEEFGKKYHILVLQEAYGPYLKKLNRALIEKGKKFFYVYNYEEEDVYSYLKNIVAIYVSSTTYDVLIAGCLKVPYNEINRDNQALVLKIPYVCVQAQFTINFDTYNPPNPKSDVVRNVIVKKSDENQEFVIMGIHVKGCATQYPKTGLESLANSMKKLWNKFEGKFPVIAIGDYNTPPGWAAISVKERIENLSNVLHLIPNYYTHVNPECLASKYDQCTIILPKKSLKERDRFCLLGKDHLSHNCQQLVDDIERNTKQYGKRRDMDNLEDM
jgi:hypothetical protein